MTESQAMLAAGVLVQLDGAREYRAALLRDLWRMRRGPNRQGVADRRRDLRAVRVRIAQLEGMAEVGRQWAAA